MTDREFEKIYEEAYRSVYWTAMSLMKNEDDTEDIVQDTFVTAYESYDQLQDKNKVVAWLKKIAANKCLNRLTRTRTANTDDEFFDNVEAEPEDFLPQSIVESDERRKIIMDIINNSLSEDIRRTIILFYFDEMTTREISEALGIPQGTVLSRLNLAKKRIKKEVEKYEEENNDKLFGMGIPFLTLLFSKEAEKVPFRPMPATLIRPSASIPEASLTKAGASSKIAAAAGAAVQKGTNIMLKKIIIGAVSVALVSTATAGIVHVVKSSGDDGSKRPSITEEEEITGSSEAPVTPDDEGRSRPSASALSGGGSGESPETATEVSTEDTAEETVETTPVPTLMPYENEDVSYDSLGANNVRFGTAVAIPFTDPVTGLDLEVKFSGDLYYDLDDGASEFSGEDIRQAVIAYASARVRNALDYVGYENYTYVFYDVGHGTAYDLRTNGYPIHNVTVEIHNISLTDESLEVYNEYLNGN